MVVDGGTTTVVAGQAERAVAAALRRLGAPHATAALVAARLVAADLDGYPSHGVMRLLEYRKAIGRGQLDPAAEPSVRRRLAGAYAVDGHRAFGALVSRETSALAGRVDLADGPVAIGVRNSGHLGRLAQLARPVAERGRVILGFVNSGGGAQKVAPAGGAAGRFATNPIVFAAPSPSRGAIVVDLTTSAASDGSVQLAAASGTRLPDGVLVDSRGGWVDDPATLNADPPSAFLAPLGGPVAHKGYALAVMVEVLAGALGGPDVVSAGNQSMGNCGFFLVFSPEVLGRAAAAVLADIGAMEEHVRSCPSSGGNVVRLPGQRGTVTAPDTLVVPVRVWRAIEDLAA